MGFWDDWESCMHTMGMPTPEEMQHGVVEMLHKLHEIELALGGISLHEAAEALHARGIVLKGGGAAAGLTVSWWAGNAIGCIVTAAIGDEIVDAIEFITAPVNLPWIKDAMAAVDYPAPNLTFQSEEQTSTSSSSTSRDLFYLPYPGNEIGKGCRNSEDVLLVQRRLAAYGYDIRDDGNFGDHTKALVEHFQSSRSLATDGIVGPNTWEALFPR